MVRSSVLPQLCLLAAVGCVAKTVAKACSRLRCFPRRYLLIMEVEPAAAAATSEENDVGEGPPSDDDDDDEQDAVDLSVGMDLSGLSKNALKRLKRKEGKRILDKEARQALLLNTRAVLG